MEKAQHTACDAIVIFVFQHTEKSPFSTNVMIMYYEDKNCGLTYAINAIFPCAFFIDYVTLPGLF